MLPYGSPSGFPDPSAKFRSNAPVCVPVLITLYQPVAVMSVPLGVNGTDMTATGWYSVISTGTQTGAFDLNFADGSGNPLGDPYGSMAYLSVVVPNWVSSGNSLPPVKILVQG